jgi:MFS family permease
VAAEQCNEVAQAPDDDPPADDLGHPAMSAPRTWTVLAALALAELLGMGLWFSATAVAPALQTHWQVTPAQAAWLTMSVQLGFVAGALGSALLNVPDRWAPRKVVAAGAWVGAALNAMIPLLDASFGPAVALRFGTGMALALVYPVGMKIMATWTVQDRGLGLGMLVGALTIGTASPHLVRAFGGIAAWQPVMLAMSVLAVAGGAIAWRVGHLGPHRSPVPPFQWRQVTEAMRQRSLRLANTGYLGHMWELYAMWTWIPAYLLDVYGAHPNTRGSAPFLASLVTFMVIAAGGIGSLLAGGLADRWGRCNTTMLSMIVSGGCAVLIGTAGLGRPGLASAIALVWGFAIVADSAQFSTSVSELAAPGYMGTQLTTQTSMGFLLTLGSIQLVPVLRESFGWSVAFGMLALGPLVGSWSMFLLRRSPDASRLAGGRG